MKKFYIITEDDSIYNISTRKYDLDLEDRSFIAHNCIDNKNPLTERIPEIIIFNIKYIEIREV